MIIPARYLNSSDPAELATHAFGDIRDHTGIEIHFHGIARLDRLRRLRTLNDRQSDVDRIPVEDPGKGFGDDTAYAFTVFIHLFD